MRAVAAKITKGINIGAILPVCDNSGAKLVRIVSVYGVKGVRGRQIRCGVGDKVKVSVRVGIPEMRKKVFDAVVVRQRKEYRRLTGERICFADNAVVILKDEKEPKGTMIRGPLPKEVADRWPGIAKIASTIV